MQVHTMLLLLLWLMLCWANGQVSEEERLQPYPLFLDSVASCCSLNEASSYNALMECVNTSKSMSNTASKVAILSYIVPELSGSHFAVPDIWEYGAYHAAVLAAYSEHNGYAYRLLTPDTSGNAEPLDPRWNKVRLLEQALDTQSGWAKDMEFIAWIDADAIVLDLGMKIDAIFHDQYPRAHLLASADIRQGYLNSGFLLMRNSKWTRKMLRDWWNTPEDVGKDRASLCDQDAFDSMYANYAREAKKNVQDLDDSLPLNEMIRVIRIDALNSKPPATIHQQVHNQVLHLMGESTSFRKAAFALAYENICMAHGEEGILATQLGLTRGRLQALALDEYRRATEAQLIELGNVENVDNKDVVQAFEKLGRAAHHLCDLLVAAQGQGSEKDKAVSEVRKVRKSIFELVGLWVEHMKSSLSEQDDLKLSQESRREMTNVLLGLLKRQAEAGNDFFGALQVSSEKQIVAKEVFTLLDDLRSRVSTSSFVVVDHMRALMHQSLGLLHYDSAAQVQASNKRKWRKLLTQAKVEMALSVAVFESAFPNGKGADRSTNKEIAHSMQLHAAILCQLDDLSQGMKQWRVAVEKATRNLQGVVMGAPLEALAGILHNAAVCHLQAEQFATAYALAQQAAEAREVLLRQEGDGHRGENAAYLRLTQDLVSTIAVKSKGKHLEPPPPTASTKFNKDEWEECQEGEEDCEAFYVDEDEEEDEKWNTSLAASSSKSENGKNFPTKPGKRLAEEEEDDEEDDDEEEERELAEIRAQYQRQTDEANARRAAAAELASPSVVRDDSAWNLQQLKAELVAKRSEVLALETQIAALEHTSQVNVKRTLQQKQKPITVEKPRHQKAKPIEKEEEKEDVENDSSSTRKQDPYFDEDDLDLIAYAKQSDAFDFALTRSQYESQAARYSVNRT